MFPILVYCLDLGNLIFDPVAVIFDRGIAIFTLGIVVFDLDIMIFGLGIAQLSSHSILLNELSRFEITPPNDLPDCFDPLYHKITGSDTDEHVWEDCRQVIVS